MPVLVGFLVYVAVTVAFALLHQLAIAGVMVFAGVVVLVILFHEFGHFITGKAFGIKVEEFFVGFGPRLWSTRRGETEYGIKAIPAGGYVRIAGMNPFQETPKEDLPRTFGAKPIWQRAIVLAAGSFTHFVLAVLILVVFFAALGPLVAEPTVDVVVPRLASGAPTPASTAGFRAGDRLLAVDGHPVTSWEDTQSYIRTHPGRPIRFEVERNGQGVTLTVTPASQDVGERGLASSASDRGSSAIETTCSLPWGTRSPARATRRGWRTWSAGPSWRSVACSGPRASAASGSSWPAPVPGR